MKERFTIAYNLVDEISGKGTSQSMCDQSNPPSVSPFSFGANENRHRSMYDTMESNSKAQGIYGRVS